MNFLSLKRRLHCNHSAFSWKTYSKYQLPPMSDISGTNEVKEQTEAPLHVELRDEEAR